MKRILFFYALLFISLNSFAQTPEKMSYQAIIRDAGNSVVANTTVGMRISILRGSTSGTVEYTETQTPTTNINGLVSIIIGDGTFIPIDWSIDNYFIKTETDPTGGTNYTITGTMQLLSVPYALHAKRADAVTAISLNNLSDAKSNTNLSSYYIGNNSGTNADDAASENTAIGTFSGNLITTGVRNTAIGAETGPLSSDLTHTTTLGYNAKANASFQVVLGTILETVIIPNKVNIVPQNEASTSGPSGGVTGDLYVESTGLGSYEKGLYYYNGTSWELVSKPKYAIGDVAFGGVIGYLDETGEHGFVVSQIDVTTPVAWAPVSGGGNSSFSNTTMAGGNGLWAGEMNTAIITGTSNFINNGAFAAHDCSIYTSQIGGGPLYGDWYLPSTWELQRMYDNRVILGLGSTKTYWSSTDAGLNSVGNAFSLDFSTGTPTSEAKTVINAVRAVRKF